jgi:hypothetical protein
MEIQALFSSVADWLSHLVSSRPPADERVAEAQPRDSSKSRYFKVEENQLQKVLLQKAAVGSHPKSLPLSAQFSSLHASPISLLSVAACSSTPENDRPATLGDPGDFTVQAGETLEFQLQGSDPDGDAKTGKLVTETCSANQE